MAEPNYSFSDVPVTTSVRSSQTATPEQLVEMGRAIWKEVNDAQIAKDDAQRNDELLAALQQKHKDFVTSFPLVLRWMVQMRQFHPEAFRKYLLKHATAQLSTREAFLELQVEYLVLLYRELHPDHPDENYVRKYRESLIRSLMEEDKAFIKIQEDVEAEMSRKKAVNDDDRRRALYAHLMAQKVRKEQAK
ncbi:MAG: hypothetical protein WC700_04025 [Gemmatimonadaceae bacterium]|jgi:hypothetical protein